MPHTGKHWYAREFNTTVKTNSLGFRDLERKVEKDANTVRISLLGDSMVAARQVNFEETAGQLLEKMLNNGLTPKTGKKYEVLNFGVGAFGLGQQLLTYATYARNFKPDFVISYIFDFPIWRTINHIRCSYTVLYGNQCLKVRPKFQLLESNLNTLKNYLSFNELNGLVKRLENRSRNFVLLEKNYLDLINLQRSKITNSAMRKILNHLIKSHLFRGEVFEYDRYKKVRADILRFEYSGEPIIKIKPRWFLGQIFNEFKSHLTNLNKNEDILKEEKILLKIYGSKNKSNFPDFEKVVFINLKVLQNLNLFVSHDNGNLIIVDSSLNQHPRGLMPAAILSKVLKEFSEINRIGHISLGQKLNKANKSGIPTHWKYDGHLNKMGNKIFANSMFEYLASKLN